jgi:hypothetical protein
MTGAIGRALALPANPSRPVSGVTRRPFPEGAMGRHGELGLHVRSRCAGSDHSPNFRCKPGSAQPTLDCIVSISAISLKYILRIFSADGNQAEKGHCAVSIRLKRFLANEQAPPLSNMALSPQASRSRLLPS